MGKQDHPFPFTGKIGKLSFFRSSVDGPMVRERRGPSKERILNDPGFINTRKAMVEFSNAGKASKLVRTTLVQQLKDIADARMTSRLTKAMSLVLQLDPVHDFGQRTVAQGDLTVLKDFDFNAFSFLKNTLASPFSTNIDKVTGLATVTIPPYVPQTNIKAPQNSTHYELIVAAAQFDFVDLNGSEVTANTGPLPLDNIATQNRVIELQLTPNSNMHRFLFLGVAFYKGTLNGTMDKLNSGAFNALSIVHISNP